MHSIVAAHLIVDESADRCDGHSSIFHLRNVMYVTSIDYHQATRLVAKKNFRSISLMSIVCARGENCHRRNCFHSGTKVCVEILKLKTPPIFSPLEILYSFTVNFFVMRELAGIGLFKKTCVKAEKMPRRCLEKFTVLAAFIISRDLSERRSVEQGGDFHRGNVSKRQYL